ncbi:SRPBCC domain-containing protein [Thalassovita sp.]|uniref:SRPBCC family protein n=1 Tax=Thalassovita sp. TaxID=1979401 RepID=UPI0029DE74EF|nr:SRPBCC domain-containing protein [Thalassovita sp.]
MTDLRIEREFPVSPDRLFRALTTQAQLLQWWGPEGMHVPEHDLDLSRLGPWYSVMVNSAGQRYKVSGIVTSYDPPRSVGFTWAWHDPDDMRGAESHVTFTVQESAAGAKLILNHRNLGNDEISANHEQGWTSSLRKLAQLLH